MPASGTRAAFQGERGAFSEEAARRILGAGVTTLPYRTFEAAFGAVVSGAADAAMVPIENTLAGSILKNYDLLVEHDLTIVGEVVLRVEHNLIAAPGVALHEIRRVLSHPVALAQCERFMGAHPDIEFTPAYDTAGSVKMVMQGGRRDEGAIASRAAAEAYGAAVLAANIESHPENFTRFFLLARPERAAGIGIRTQQTERKTSVVFQVGNRPGTLYRALAAFAEQGVDLTKIESRPIPGRPWEYSFYLDLAGAGTDPAVARALDQLRALADSLRVLGSYPRAET